MSASPTTPDALVGVLTSAIDGVARLDLGSVQASEAAELLEQLSTLTDRLAGEVARTAAVVAAGSAWSNAGATSPAAFVSNTTAVGLGRARGLIELGEAMTELPALDAAVRSGKLSTTAAAKVLPAKNDPGFSQVAADLIGELHGSTPIQAQRHIEAWQASANPVDDRTRRAAARDTRRLTFTPIGDGMTRLSGDVPDTIGQSLRRSLKHLADQQRSDGSERTTTQQRVDALGDLAAAYERGEVKGGRNLPRVIVTMNLDTFENRGGIATNSFGELVPDTEIDRLCCDAVIHRLVFDQRGAVIDFGRGKRTASPQQFLALVARDGGCRHPGCERPPEWCEAHHLREFVAQRGSTNLDELVLLCHHHHHALHDHGWTLTGTATELVFTGPDGRQLISTLPRHVMTIAA